MWTSDSTYLRTREGCLYPRAVRDGCSRRVIGWAIEEYLHTDLVQAALAMDVTMRDEPARSSCTRTAAASTPPSPWRGLVASTTTFSRLAARQCVGIMLKPNHTGRL